MKYRITESRLRSIINNAVRTVLKEEVKPLYKRDYEIPGERFDELLRQNNVTIQDLYDVVANVNEDRITDCFNEDEEPDIYYMFEEWIEMCYCNPEFEEMINGLKGVNEREAEAIECGDILLEDSKILYQVFEEIYNEAYKRIKEEFEDERGFDPWYDYVHPWDFYSK